MSSKHSAGDGLAAGDMLHDIDNLEVKDAVTRLNLLQQLSRHHKELQMRQYKYKKTLSMRYKTRIDTIIEKSYIHTAESMRQERNDLRAQIWVADGVTHTRNNDNLLGKIQCHVKCQQRLAKRINELKTDIMNVERGIHFINRQIYELNMKTVPETQHQAHVAATRKKLALLENRLEVGIRQESAFTALNAVMGERLRNIIYDRKCFFDMFTKLMQSLTNDKKYLMELMECAVGVFDSCIDAHDKIELVMRKNLKENDARKIEAQAIMRHKTAQMEAESFLNCKAKARKLAPLQPKEIRRRQKFVHDHQHKLHLYDKVLRKLLEYYQASDVGEVTDRFQQQESLYYSYFSYSNEMSYHVELLSKSVNRLYGDVENLRSTSQNIIFDQIETIQKYEDELNEKRLRNQDLAARKNNNDQELKKYFSSLNEIIHICRLNISPLLERLGDHSRLNITNVQRFMKLLERRVIRIVANVFCEQRKAEGFTMNTLTVKAIEKLLDAQTDIQDIVMTQQCPECAEGEAFNMDEMAEVHVSTVKEIKQNLEERVKQPEMQYRLHNISQCRLPRSRFLAAKRHAP